MFYSPSQDDAIGFDDDGMLLAVVDNRALLAQGVYLRVSESTNEMMIVNGEGQTSIWFTAGISYFAFLISSRCFTPLQRTSRSLMGIREE